ncbi:DUF262 domain-containing protein [Aeromonas veronii]|uniref:DUF262 domain-containing protein n=1 Tax=Aeromonas veronii TaxID=654 RepID=UPI002B462F4C|nr:DUF262 domain-containing protein [Aeromonas veronii]
MFKIQKHETKTLSWWHRQRSNIDFSPSYQRKGGVWTSKSKSYLIDSIINGFDIPKIYLADFSYSNSTLNEKFLPYAVIDGKQRLLAIFEFLDDKLALSNEIVFYSDTNVDLRGLRYSDIKSKYPEIAYDIIDQFNLDVVSVVTDEEGKINELFIRLNQGASLKGAEIRNAKTGVIADTVRSICNSTLFKKSTYNKTRGQDQNTAAKICLIAANNEFVNTKKRDLDKFYETEEFDISERVLELPRYMDEIGEYFSEGDIGLKSEAIIPLVYMLFVKNKDHDLRGIATFINEFAQVRKALRTTSIRQEEIPIEYILFDKYIRNANDASGLNGAFNILQKLYIQSLDEV